MDVDDFKLVNDRHGHSAGDRLLRNVAEAIRKDVREFDLVSRIGGDEFVILMPETGEHAARAVVRRVRRRLLEVVRAKGWPVTFSIGVVTWDAPPASVDEMLREADDLMYSAKRGGKNAVRHKVSNAPQRRLKPPAALLHRIRVVGFRSSAGRVPKCTHSVTGAV